MPNPSQTRSIAEAFLSALDARSVEGVLATLGEDVAHDVPGEGRRIGREAFESHMIRRARTRAERLADVVVLVSDDGTRAAAEFTVRADEAAGGRGASWRGAVFLEVEDERIVRVTEYVDADERDRQTAP